MQEEPLQILKVLYMSVNCVSLHSGRWLSVQLNMYVGSCQYLVRNGVQYMKFLKCLLIVWCYKSFWWKTICDTINSPSSEQNSVVLWCRSVCISWLFIGITWNTQSSSSHYVVYYQTCSSSWAVTLRTRAHRAVKSWHGRRMQITHAAWAR